MDDLSNFISMISGIVSSFEYESSHENICVTIESSDVKMDFYFDPSSRKLRKVVPTSKLVKFIKENY